MHGRISAAMSVGVLLSVDLWEGSTDVYLMQIRRKEGTQNKTEKARRQNDNVKTEGY